MPAKSHPQRGGLAISAERVLALSAAVLQQSLFQLLLAFDAMPRPGHRLQALGVDLLSAGDTLPEAAFANAAQSAVHHLQELAVVIALRKQKFLVVGVGRPVSDVLGRLQISVPAVLGGAIHCVPQFPLAVLQSLLENIEFLFLHSAYPTNDPR